MAYIGNFYAFDYRGDSMPVLWSSLNRRWEPAEFPDMWHVLARDIEAGDMVIARNKKEADLFFSLAREKSRFYTLLHTTPWTRI